MTIDVPVTVEIDANGSTRVEFDGDLIDAGQLIFDVLRHELSSCHEIWAAAVASCDGADEEMIDERDS